MLELEGVRSGYGKLEIVQAASLQVGDGAIVGIIGPNGAGKSTLLKTAFGYLPPFAGRIALDGREIAGRRPDAIMRLGVAYPAQAGGAFAGKTLPHHPRPRAHPIPPPHPPPPHPTAHHPPPPS